MSNKKRDDFSKSVINTLAERVAYICSNPNCMCQTVGPSSDKNKKTNIGVAAHICAAAPGGPRYDEKMTSKQRSDIDNGIWLCQSCSKLIDTDEKEYTVELLKEWKLLAENYSKEKINKKDSGLHNNKSISGWVGYCNWSNRSSDETPYIIKEDSIIYEGSIDSIHKKSLIEGIKSIRKDLSEARSSVRLAGLSGTGKTRLAQALFDETISDNALDKSLVIYGDIGDKPNPEPIEYIRQLINEKMRVILIVDNCEASMHNELTRLCQVQESNVSLMTIEYDVKEDDNVDSNNYYLGPTTPEILKELLKRDYDYINDSNIESIVRYSDGNYRIAIYLAKSINKNENIGVLKDNNLLERLFYQGNKTNETMMKVGEVCSLFYSFSNNYEEVESNEINIISKISNLSPEEITSYVEELRQKQIIQKRGNMRAVLPHALANRLASDYLDHYPINNIIDIIGTNDRLLKSFFRRLKNLHNNEKALNLAESYLTNLSDENLINANNTLIEILKCINILHPSKLLYRIKAIKKEKFFTRQNPNFYDWVLMLSYTAYEEKYFPSAVAIIVRFALSEEPGNNSNSIRSILSNLFHIYLSQTHAPLKDRLDVIDDLINSNITEEQELGLSLIDAMLEFGGTFVGSPMYDTGTKIRDYGLIPKPAEWFKEAFDYIDKLLESNVLYDEIKEIVANNFTNLYRCGFGDILDNLVRKNLKIANWPRIWVALLAIKRMDKDNIPDNYLKMINDLIELVKPSNTKERLETYLYGGRKVRLGLDIAYNNFEEVNKRVYELGKEVGSNKLEIKDNLLLINNDYDLFRINYLAKGIYDSTDDKERLIYLILEIINENNERVLKNMLNCLVSLYHNDDSNACNKLLDEILLDEKHNKYFLVLQLSYSLDDKSVERIENSIEKGLIDDDEIYRVEPIVKELKTDQIISLLNKIKQKTKNGNVIIDTLLRLSEQGILDEKLKKCARENITELDFEEYNKHGHRMYTYSTSELIKKVFDDKKGEKEAKIIFLKIRNMLDKMYVSFYDLKDILEPMINKYPKLFLDIFIDYKGEPSYYVKKFFQGFSRLNGNIINQMQCCEVIDWIKQTKKDLEISYLLEPYKIGEDNNFVWNELAEYLFDNYSNIEVVKNIADNIYPRSWENEFSIVMKRRYNMILNLKESKDRNIKKIGKEKYEEYQLRLEWHLDRERKEHEDGFGRFED